MTRMDGAAPNSHPSTIARAAPSNVEGQGPTPKQAERAEGLGTIAAAAGLLVALALPVSAHHSFSAEFDSTKAVTLEGEVVMMEWVNPHSWLHIDVKKPDGSVERWKIEGGSPSVLFRLGWNRELAAGRHEGHSRRLPGEGRLAPGQFA